jgi:ferredoxin--NADP+ reductase
MTLYDNYSYVPMTTREPEDEGNKLYIQDLLRSDGFAEALGGPPDPDNLHIFLCGNPAMIGLPEWESETPTYPREEGAAEILASLGFIIDRRGVAGNVHYEEYW